MFMIRLHHALCCLDMARRSEEREEMSSGTEQISTAKCTIVGKRQFLQVLSRLLHTCVTHAHKDKQKRRIKETLKMSSGEAKQNELVEIQAIIMSM